MHKISCLFIPRPSSFGSFDEFKSVIRQVKNMGYKGIEFGLGIPMGFEPDRLMDYLYTMDLSVSAVLTGINAADNLYLSVADEDVRNKAVQRLQELIPIAKKLRTTMIVGTMQGTRRLEPNREVGKERILACLKQVALTAEEYGQSIVLEPMNHMECGYGYTLDEVMETIDQIGSPFFKPMLDTIHMNIEERSIVDTFHKAGSELLHVHLCETNARAAGQGHLDYRAVFKALDDIHYNHWIAVKAYQMPSWLDGASASMEYLKRLGLA